MNTNMQREKLIYRYMLALERGDLDTVFEILEHSEYDEILESSIQGLHASMIDEEDRAIIKELARDFRGLLQHALSSS